MLHLTPRLLRLFTWSIISATKKLTMNTALHFSVLANPRLTSFGVNEELGTLSVTGLLHKKVVSLIYSLHG